MTFNAILLERDANKVFSSKVTQVAKTQLAEQEGDTLIKVDYSTLNYKDALALTNSSPVVRMWPMVPGIDCVGSVVSCKSGQFKEGQKVILNGWGCGETHWGCLAQYAQLKSEWLIPLPEALTPWQAMALGTAGYTAALCVRKIVKHGVQPSQGKVLVTGATGGVGSIAIALLIKMGYQVVAATSPHKDSSYLQKLGVSEIIDRATLSEAGKPLQKELWSAVVDVCGSHTLANACAQTQYGGIVAACGLAQGLELPSSVAPFILRGVTLAGVDSVMAPYQDRVEAWDCLAQYLDTDVLTHISQTIPLADSFEIAKKIMAGEIQGRYVVDVNDVK